MDMRLGRILTIVYRMVVRKLPEAVSLSGEAGINVLKKVARMRERCRQWLEASPVQPSRYKEQTRWEFVDPP